MLIRNAELEGGVSADVRVTAGRIAAIGRLSPEPAEEVLEARGGLLLPGLHDHHIHLAAFAAGLDSVRCGPPEVIDAEALAVCLRVGGRGWLRAVGYHESVAGMLDAPMLDRIVEHRPVRVQHRSGRMWFFNSRALGELLEANVAPPGLEREGGRFTGRLFDDDAWLRRVLGGQPPSFTQASARLASYGVTGLTDMSPGNDAVMARHFAAEIEAGDLTQRVILAGRSDLAVQRAVIRLALGPVKLHLHEAALPALDDAVRIVTDAHSVGRSVAVHCTTDAELFFILAVFAEAGVGSGDRLEHASVAADFAIEDIARLGLAVATQPHFISERGDAYIRDVDVEQQPLLYRLRGFLDAGVTLAAGSDAPFGAPDPWMAMAAAVSRKTREGATIGGDEALTPEEALDLYLRAPDALGLRRRVAVGAPADLCLLHQPWAKARATLNSSLVRAAFVAGRRIDDLVDQPPA